jgi:hypothetical protein
MDSEDVNRARKATRIALLAYPAGIRSNHLTAPALRAELRRLTPSKGALRRDAGPYPIYESISEKTWALVGVILDEIHAADVPS